ncbi:NAD(P)-binding domain-containing protein [Actinomadura sp. ATCC 31491]|uniref:NAD(P)-binding domain-containing protein n=1 Tax=Actinomadura luzonensis TaxID=2805427 RepID=A0ABT0FQX1_9ACTN|nr:NAD(P)-binding domain-containing protein [Actinomadura luzonensis]MCK2214318.1 NAD(P)-binding domain-containing protein [Actinomadura luzonensis]
MDNSGDDRTPVSVIGLGMMGQALAGAFVRAGHPTTVWNRTAGKADQLVALGAREAGSVAEAVAAAPLTVVCVLDETAVGALVEPLEAVVRGRVLVNLTSGTSQGARELGERVERWGGRYLDGAIMAVPQAVGTDEAVLVYSGARDAFDRHAEELRGLGGSTYLGADHGLSSLFEAAVLSLMWNLLNGFLHGAALLGAAGVPATTFAPLARTAIGTVTGWLPDYARQVDERSYPPLDSTLDTHLAAMGNLVKESEALGVGGELPRFVQALAERAAASGRGGDGYAALVEQFREP